MEREAEAKAKAKREAEAKAKAKRVVELMKHYMDVESLSIRSAS